MPNAETIFIECSFRPGRTASIPIEKNLRASVYTPSGYYLGGRPFSATPYHHHTGGGGSIPLPDHQQHHGHGSSMDLQHQQGGPPVKNFSRQTKKRAARTFPHGPYFLFHCHGLSFLSQATVNRREVVVLVNRCTSSGIAFFKALVSSREEVTVL